MKLSEHKDLKIAITDLPLKEKDKLLLRLVAKDKILTEHLHFKLLEDESDLEARKEIIKAEVDEQVPQLKKVNAKDGLAAFRKLITRVNQFYKITKDPLGEVELKIYILSSVPLEFKRSLFGYRDFGFLFANFYIKTASVTFNKFGKLHEDLQFDLSESLNQLLKRIARSSGLPEEI